MANAKFPLDQRQLPSRPPAEPASGWSNAMRAVLTALIIVFTGRGISIVADAMGASPALSHWLDDTLTGIVAGGFTYVLLLTESNRRRANLKRLRDIGDMNHHVRNALEVIRSAHWAATDNSRLELIAEASDRIERALRDFKV